jgi:ATP/maltotriose-dependent transcriptional regulator MalT
MADQAYVLHEHECRIGRDETCHIRIADNGRISREHAIIRHEGQGYVFYDHSLNGSAINGKRVHQSRQLLHHGDLIGLADFSVLFSFCDPAEEAVELPSVAEPLTSRESEVLRLAAAGLTNQAIADRLYISSNTVKFHLRAVYGKLGVADRLRAINRARALGLL